MTKEVKKSPELQALKQMPTLAELKNMMPTRKENPIMVYLDTFDREWKKRKRALQSGEVLFSPGEDPHLYIITKGFVNILRNTASGQTKEIGNARAGSFMGE
jgi:CRP-like cAMP-binding protein